jgi:hypothetical protein
MPASQFDDTLHLMDPAKDQPIAGLRAGPCGRGPIDGGGTILSMQIWLVQNNANGVAIATGRSGEGLGTPPETPPYQGKWMVRTGLDKASAEFTTDRPVMAWAIAVMKAPEGPVSVDQWTEAVTLHAGH